MLVVYLAMEFDVPGIGLGISLILAAPQLAGMLQLGAPPLIGRLADRKRFCLAAYLLTRRGPGRLALGGGAGAAALGRDVALRAGGPLVRLPGAGVPGHGRPLVVAGRPRPLRIAGVFSGHHASWMAAGHKQKKERRSIDPDNIEKLAERYGTRLPYKSSACRYHSFVTYFSMLQKLGWTEPSGHEERSSFQENYPDAQPRKYFRLTRAGISAGDGAWLNPHLTLYG